MKTLIKYFLQGLLLIAPLGITLFIIYSIFKFVDNLMYETMLPFLKVTIPGLGLVFFVILIILTGLLGQTYLARPIRSFFRNIIERTPFLKVIYAALNDLFSAFIGKEKKFNKPVLVLVNPISNLEKLGFLTGEDLSKLDQKDKFAVYFPHSYNFSGELFIVPKEHIKPLDIDPVEAMKFIVSGGVSGLEKAGTDHH